MTFRNLSFLLPLSLMVLLAACHRSYPTLPTENEELLPFSITIKKMEREVVMSCISGCAWKELSFRINNGQTQAVNEYGMTPLDAPLHPKDYGLAHFLFTISPSPNHMKLKGIKGTDWIDLGFSYPKAVINPEGVTPM